MTPSQPSLQARSQGLGSFERFHALQGGWQGQLVQQRTTSVERQQRQVAAIEPENVEHMVAGLALLAPYTGGLAVEYDVVDRQAGDRLDDGRIGSGPWQPVARQQTDVWSIFEREQADAVQLALEDPLRTGEPLMSEGRGHGLDPFGNEAVTRAPPTPTCPLLPDRDYASEPARIAEP